MNTPEAPAVGIDLGTTFSAIAYLDETCKPRIIPNREGDTATPSMVHFHPLGVVVGKEAERIARYEPESVAQFAKRDMGKSMYHRPICGQRLPPEVIQALILRKLTEDAATKLGPLRKVVITVPAFFNEPRRKATMDAGTLAGLEVLDIINEPTAAAIACGVLGGFLSDCGQPRRTETILVYDLGGGTFDATLMEIDGLHYRALATDGDVFLGGIDWDWRIVDYVAEKFQAEHGEDPRQHPEGWISLFSESEEAKRALTVCDRTAIHFAVAGHHTSVTITRDQFEAMTEDLIGRTMFTTTSLLRDGGRKWSDLTRILLVGGSSRMPMVQKAIERESGLQVDRSLLAEEPVALGAALYAGFLLRGSDSPRLDIAVQNVSSHPLGVLGVERETGLPRRKILIPRNTLLPATGSGIFSTLCDNQPSVVVNVVEGGDDSGKNATQIGKCVVSGLPPGLPAGTRTKVRFSYGANGRLAVNASLPGTNCQVVMAVERASGLSETMIAQWRSRIEKGTLIEAAGGDPAAITETVANEATGQLAIERNPSGGGWIQANLSGTPSSSETSGTPWSPHKPSHSPAFTDGLDEFLKDLK